jgi:phenylacetic acid degradation operon negative regulatory protein
MHARSALFDVYGDHLHTRGNQAPIASLVRLLAPVGIGAPAVRTAVSRMVSQGWLAPVTLPAGPGYRATDQAVRRLADTADRIYRRGTPAWDGRWRLAFVDAPRDRSARNRLRDELGFLGMAEYAPGVWVGPWPRADLRTIVERAGGSVRTAVAETFDVDPAGAWDLPSLAAAYDDWTAAADRLVETELGRHADEDEAMFAARFHLVHEWRKFLFSDPGLPSDLLPDRWPGRVAEELFQDEATRLEAGATRFVVRCLRQDAVS